jgi:signal transduction histidine kinase
MSGSGLGLAIVRQVAETHGGRVVAERPEDGGTLMRLRLNGSS